MSSENNETSTLEMENSDKILQAINGLRQDVTQRLDKIESEQAELRKEFNDFKGEFNDFKSDYGDFKNFVEAQFEAIRQGIVRNYNQFDRLESQIAENRSVIFSTKALVGELNEKVYLLSRSTEQSLK